MEIILSNSDKRVFAVAKTWENANIAAKAIIKKQYWSDLYYKLQFDNGDIAEGSIDLEPYSFHQPHLKTIVTNHLKTWWTNISELPYPNKYGIPGEDIETCKQLLNHLPQ